MYVLQSNTLNLGGKNQLTRPVTVTERTRTTRLRNKFLLTVHNTNAAAYVFTNADMVALCATLMHDTINNYVGDRVKDIFDEGLNAQDLRVLGLVLTSRDFLVNGVPLNQYSGTVGTFTANGSGTNGGNTALIVEMERPFVYEREGTRITKYCPGWTQTRQVGCEFNSTAGSYSTNTGQVTVTAGTWTVLADSTPSGRDPWVSVPRIKKVSVGINDIYGPSGKLFALLETSFAGASTPLTYFSLRRNQDSDLHTDASGADVVRDSQLQNPIGAYDPNNIVTVLWQPNDSIVASDLPVSDQFQFHAVALDINPFNLQWIYIPTIDRAFNKGIGQNVTESESGKKGPTVLGVNEAAFKNIREPSYEASVSPIVLLTPDDPDYNLHNGTLYRAGMEPIDWLPQHVAGTAASAVNSLGSSPGAVAVAAKAASQITAAIPAANSSNATQATATQATVMQVIAPAVVKGAGIGAIAGLIKRQ